MEYSDIIEIRLCVLELDNSFVAIKLLFEPIKKETIAHKTIEYSQLGQFLAYSDRMGIKKYSS